MKRTIIMAGLILCLALPSWAQTYSQSQHNGTNYDHGELGIYGDYFRFNPGASATNFVGVGGRVGVNLNPYVALEGEMNYDFAQNFTTTSNNGATTSFARTSVRPLTGLFGPKLQAGTSGPFRAFVTGKLGFVDFSTNTTGVVSGSTFTNSVQGVGGSGTHLAFYPGGGIEGFLGPIGLRAEVGDEIYLNNGTYNNLRITFGPTFRF